jgi:RimJ/RimL family protein N-acetyltransferase
MPCVEIGWRLAADQWGRGYATEGARAALAFGFGTLGLPEIVSFTTVDNHRSRRVMTNIGMIHNPADDFDHPSVTGRLRRHVLYRIVRDDLRREDG